MNNPQSTESKAPLRNVSRRAFLPGLIIGIAGLNYLVIKFFIPKAAPLPDPRPKSPRYPKHKNVELTKLNVTPGFYRNLNSDVVHYFSGAPTLFKEGAQEYLTLVNPTETPINARSPRVGRPRVNLGRSSYYFEQAAAAEIQKSQIDAACELLFYAVSLEMQSTYRAARLQYFLPFKKSPSFRLYDLLAGVSVRFKQEEYLERTIALIKNSREPQIRQSFESRLKKWDDPKSSWRRRWTDTQKPIKWTVIKGLDLLM